MHFQVYYCHIYHFFNIETIKENQSPCFTDAQYLSFCQLKPSNQNNILSLYTDEKNYQKRYKI